ncbi:tRNA-dihydrouridine synthase [Burkholderiaceae bacterium DAT-1]|nr:tRNA-dihydrouridine synthase [Burkholderiaceae bacterium DAT-1]
MRIALAPMEGLVDAPLRHVLTSMGGIDWCVTEFVRVTSSLLPAKVFHRYAPEAHTDWKTASGVPLRLQLLGSDPQCLAENAARAAELGAPVIDLNFGCPAKGVNQHRGGAVLLKEPDLLYEIVRSVRAAVPAHIPVTSKMRLGYEDTSLALDCARALDTGGSAEIVVHARTKVDGYKPPAHWYWIAHIREVVKSAHVIANGEIWTVEDFQACQKESGCEDVMLGRGLVASPDLALRAKLAAQGHLQGAMPWPALLPWLVVFHDEALKLQSVEGATGRVKQWLGYMRQQYAEAGALFREIRAIRELPRDLLNQWSEAQPH